MYEDQEKNAQAKLADLAKQKLVGLKHESHVPRRRNHRHTEPQDSFRCDLLVMATHGRRGLACMFLSSVAEAVIRKATCPALM
jgi:nucleotide-binding universal stress UspA family protein